MAKKKPKPPSEESPAEESTVATAVENPPEPEHLESETEPADGELTLEAATAIEKERLEAQLVDEMEELDEAIKYLKEARQAHKDAKTDVEAVRGDILKTNQALREVIRGRWRPAKPDPQRQLDFPEEGEPEAESLWRSKPISELGLPKTILTKLENENLTTLGAIVSEMEQGGKFEGLDFSDKQLSKIESAVHQHRPAPEVPEGGECDGENGGGDESEE